MDVLNVAAQIAIHGVAIVSTLFVILYWIGSDWTRNYGGRAVMVMAIAFAAFVDEVTVRIWIPLADTPWRRLFDLTMYVAVLASWIWLLINMLRARRQAIRARNEKDGSQ